MLIFEKQFCLYLFEKSIHAIKFKREENWLVYAKKTACKLIVKKLPKIAKTKKWFLSLNKF